jgi:hypothetical protein
MNEGFWMPQWIKVCSLIRRANADSNYKYHRTQTWPANPEFSALITNLIQPHPLAICTELSTPHWNFSILCHTQNVYIYIFYMYCICSFTRTRLKLPAKCMRLIPCIIYVKILLKHFSVLQENLKGFTLLKETLQLYKYSSSTTLYLVPQKVYKRFKISGSLTDYRSLQVRIFFTQTSYTFHFYTCVLQSFILIWYISWKLSCRAEKVWSLNI